jgi:hypothetical protein
MALHPGKESKEQEIHFSVGRGKISPKKRTRATPTNGRKGQPEQQPGAFADRVGLAHRFPSWGQVADELTTSIYRGNIAGREEDYEGNRRTTTPDGGVKQERATPHPHVKRDTTGRVGKKSVRR